jgi:hypothetical protein
MTPIFSPKSLNMQQRTILFGALISLLFLFSSCLKDPFGNNPFDGNFTARIDGKKFNGATESATLTQTAAIEAFYLGGVDSEGHTLLGENSLLWIILYIPPGGAIEAKEYAYSGDLDCDQSLVEICGALTYGTNIGSSNTDEYSSSDPEGKFTIKFSSIDYRPGGHAKGTFSGTMVHLDTGEKLEVKDGKFDVEIQ